jgi:uncharacterized protein with GYD domain
MATYLMTFCYTQQGLQEIRNGPERLETAKQLVRKLGGEIKLFLSVLGAEFDTMCVVEAPDDKTAAKMALGISALGKVRSSTHRAFGEQEFKEIIAGVR